MKVSAAEISGAMEHCRQLTRREAKNFYYGLKLSPEPQRSALYAVYAWMRGADDLVDGAGGDRQAGLARIARYRGQTDAALAGQPGDDPLFVALAEVARSFQIRREDLHAMLDGQADDLSVNRYESFEQLRGYCQRVGSTVGLVCLDVWGSRDAYARQLGIERGIAFQLTNILRDFAEDLRDGRVYLPREDFQSHGLEPEQLMDWRDPRRCEGFLREQLARAASFYESSAALDGMLQPRFRPTLWAMTAIYRRLLDRMIERPMQIVGGSRVRLSTWRKAVIAWQARAMQRRAEDRRIGLVEMKAAGSPS